MIILGVEIDPTQYFDHSPRLMWLTEDQYWTWVCMVCESAWPWFCVEMPEYEGEDYDDDE